MAVQYIELGEDPNIKALRETILGVSSSIAGGIAMRRKQQNDLAMQAMKAAHQNYLTQVGIESREKIASEGHRLQQESLDLQEDRFQHEKNMLENEVNAAEGFDFWMDSSLNFELDANGKLVKSGDTEQLKNAIKKINLHPGTRTKYTQAKLAIGEQQRTIGARVLAVKSAFEADRVRTSPFLQSVLENGQINYSQLSKLARSDTWYKEVVDAGLVPDVTTGQKWQDENFQTYLNASTDFLKPDGTSWLAGPYSPANVLQRRAVTSYNRAGKEMETISKLDKTRPEITDVLSSVEEGVDPFDDGRKNLVTQLVFSNAKPTMQSSGFIPANVGQIRAYTKQQISALSDKLEVKLKNDGNYDTKEENYSQLFQDKYKQELEQFGIKVLEKPKGNYTEVGMYYLSKVMQGDVADEQGVLPSQKLYAHIMSNNPRLVGKHVNEILDPNNKEAKIIGDNFRNGNITVGNLYNQPKNVPVIEVKGDPKDGVQGADAEMSTIYNNFPSIPQLSGDYTEGLVQLERGTNLAFSEQDEENIKNWYNNIQKKEITGINGINTHVKEMLATKQGRKELASLYKQSRRGQGRTVDKMSDKTEGSWDTNIWGTSTIKSMDKAAQVADSVTKLHLSYVGNMMLQDPALSGWLETTKKSGAVYNQTPKSVEEGINNPGVPPQIRDRLKYFHEVLGGNKDAYFLLNIIMRNMHGMNYGK